MKKILVAYDGSEASMASVRKAEELIMQGEDVYVCLFSIANTSNPHTTVMMQRRIMDDAVEQIKKDHDEKVKNEELLRVKKQLNDLKETFGKNGINIDTKVIMTEGNHNPGQDICEYAAANNFDVIVVGSRGLGNIRKVILGSVSNHIVNHSNVPVLVVK